MPDSTYRSKVYRARGGDQLVAATGGSISIDGGTLKLSSGTAAGTLTVYSGGNIAVNSGATFSVAGGLNLTSGGASSLAGAVTVAAAGSLTIAKGSQFTAGTGSKRVYGFRTVTGSVTLAASESGVTVRSNVVGNVITLPSATTVGKGVNYRIVLGQAGTATTGKSITVKPPAADKLFGGGVAGATDSETLILNNTDAKSGAFLDVMSDGTDWQATAYAATWTRAAAT